MPLRDQPTLHTIGLSGPLKFRIGRAVDKDPRRQTLGIHCRYSAVLFGRLPIQAPMLVVHGLAHTVSRKCVDVVGLGLFEKRRHVARGHRVARQARFESFQRKSCHHQQPRN